MKKWFLILLILTGCQVNEADFPELAVDDPQQIGTSSAVMGAQITEIGPVRPMNYGILWDSQSDITIVSAKNKVTLGSASAPKKFSIKVESLLPGTTYYYRGFAASQDNSHFYYSGVMSFTTLP